MVVEGRRARFEVRKQVVAQITQCIQHRLREIDTVVVRGDRPGRGCDHVQHARRQQVRNAGDTRKPIRERVHAEVRQHHPVLPFQQAVDHHARTMTGIRIASTDATSTSSPLSAAWRQCGRTQTNNRPDQPGVERFSGELGVEHRVVALRRVHQTPASASCSSDNNRPRRRCVRSSSAYQPSSCINSS